MKPDPATKQLDALDKTSLEVIANFLGLYAQEPSNNELRSPDTTFLMPNKKGLRSVRTKPPNSIQRALF